MFLILIPFNPLKRKEFLEIDSESRREDEDKI